MNWNSVFDGFFFQSEAYVKWVYTFASYSEGQLSAGNYYDEILPLFNSVIQNGVHFW